MLRYQIHLRALQHNPQHGLRRAEEARHQLGAQVQEEAHQLRVVPVRVHHLLLQRPVDVHQQEDAHLVRVHSLAPVHVPPQPLDPLARGDGEELKSVGSSGCRRCMPVDTFRLLVE